MIEGTTDSEPVLRIESVAHGGVCVARLPGQADEDRGGRVVFVRHALPGELVRVRFTDTSHAGYWRGDAVEILEAHPDRVGPRCPVARPGGCGGCDWQHASASLQRELKATVVAEQLSRLAKIQRDVVVEEVPPEFGWRTRMRYRIGPRGVGLLAHRSHEVIPLPPGGCPIAAGPPPSPEAVERAEAAVTAEAGIIDVVESARRRSELVGGVPLDGDDTVVEHAAGRDFEVAADGFWQVHPAAADTLVAAVLEGLDPKPGERAFDFYSGVGLFAGALADAGVTVWGVESDKPAISNARRNVRAARFSSGRVESVLRKLPRRTDLVVLDPPRTGAGRRVLTAVSERQPRAIAYVACDPAALGRDLAYAAELGLQLGSLRAFDLFPQTHHVECVAILTPRS